MIQCPICQMINDDQSRFCAECGARLGPSQTAQPSPAPQPQRQPPSQPQAGLPRTPSSASAPPEPPQAVPAADKARPPETGKKLRSPLLAGDLDEEFDSTEGPGGGPAGRRPISPRGSEPPGPRKLHSPLLGDIPGLGYEAEPNPEPSGRKLHSPLLGEGGYDEPSDYAYGSPGGSAPAGGKLRSRLLSGGGSDSFDEYYAYDEQEEIDEDDPNVLRSPLLSARTRRPAQGPAGAPQSPGGPALPAQSGPAAPPGPHTGPQPASPAHGPGHAGAESPGHPAPHAPQAHSHPKGGMSPAAASPGGFARETQPHAGSADLPRADRHDFPAPGRTPEASQEGVGSAHRSQGPGPGSDASSGFGQLSAKAPWAPEPQAPAVYSQPSASGPSTPDVARESAEDSSAGRGAEPQDAFPDMSRFRRDSQPVQSQRPKPQPELPPVPQARLEPTRSRSEEWTEPAAAEGARPPRKVASKLLAGPQDDPADSFAPQPRSFGSSGPGSFGAPPPGSPLPKILGGAAVFLALLKLPTLLATAGAYMAQNPPFVLDQFATFLALILLGAAFLMSKS